MALVLEIIIHKCTDPANNAARPLAADEKANPARIPSGLKPFQLVSLSTGGYRPNTTISINSAARSTIQGRISVGEQHEKGWIG